MKHIPVSATHATRVEPDNPELDRTVFLRRSAETWAYRRSDRLVGPLFVSLNRRVSWRVEGGDPVHSRHHGAEAPGRKLRQAAKMRRSAPWQEG